MCAPCVSTYTVYNDELAAMNRRFRFWPPKLTLAQVSGRRMNPMRAVGRHHLHSGARRTTSCRRIHAHPSAAEARRYREYPAHEAFPVARHLAVEIEDANLAAHRIGDVDLL